MAENYRRVAENEHLDERQRRIEAAAWDMIAFGRTYLPHYFTDEPADFHPQLVGLLTNCDPTEWYVTEPNPDYDAALPTEPIFDRQIPGDNVVDFVNHPLRKKRDARSGKTEVKGGIVVAAPRGHGKSVLLSLVIPLYCACYKLRRFILIVSDTDPQVRKLCEAIKVEIEENELLRRDFGDMTGKKYHRAWTGENFTVCHADTDAKGRVRVVYEMHVSGRSVGSRVRGMRHKQYRPDLIICDDIENDVNIASKEMRDQLFHKVVSVYFPALDPKTGIMLFCGTILHFDSVLARLIFDPDFSDGYLIRKWAATIDSIPVTDDRAIPIWPARWTLEYLRLQRSKMRPGPFNREYMNDPHDPEARDFLPQWIRWWHGSDIRMLRSGRMLWKRPDDPDDDELRRMPYGRHRETFWQELSLYQTVDPAISKAQEADYFTMGCAGCAKRTEDLVFIWLVRERLDFAAQLRMIEAMVNLFPRTRQVGIDNNAYQDTLVQATSSRFRRRYGRTRVPLKRLRQKSGAQTKETRLRRRAVEVEQGVVWLRCVRPGDDEYEKAPWDETHTVKIHPNHYPLYQEMMQFPRGQHDDCLDVLDMLLAISNRTRVFEDYAERERVALGGKARPTSTSVNTRLLPLGEDPNWAEAADVEESEAA